MAANEVEIVNFALAKLGARRILSITDTNNENARLANIHYEQTVRSVLRSHPWSCCTKRDTLARLASAPEFGFAYAYQLPNDFLRAISVNDVNSLGDRDKWVVEQDMLLSDDESIQLVYVYYEEDATQYDELLVEAISVKLAAKLAAPITGNPATGQEFLREYEAMAFPSAARVDAQESHGNQNHPLQKVLSQSVMRQRRRYSPLG